MEAPSITQLQEQIRRLEQERDAALEQLRQLQRPQEQRALCGTVQDITERKHMEQSLRESEERLHLALEAAQMGVWELRLGDKSTIRSLEHDRIFGYETLLPQWTYEMFLDHVMPEDRQKVDSKFRNAVTNGTAWHFECRIKGANGAIRWIEAQGRRVPGEEKEQDRMVGVVADITARKRAEEALRLSRDTLQAVLDAAPAGVVVADAAGGILFASAETQRIFGGPVTGDAHGPAGGYHLCMPDGSPIAPGELPLSQALAGQEVTEREILIKRADGSYIFILASATPLRTAAGQPQGAITVFHDITDFKRAAEELKHAKAAAEEATRAKSEFLAKMSHEIRTPMTVFMAAVEHLLQIDRNPERRHLLGMADQSGQRLRTLIDGILDLSRIEARKVVIDEMPFDVRATVGAAVDLFTLTAREKNLRLETDVAPDTPEVVTGDPDKIGQVLINLIGNAVKFTYQGEVRVCVHPRGDFLEFAVADTGIGIPEEKQNLLFQSFSQLNNSETGRFGGSGLGLAISKGLVELMSGEIYVQSRAAQGSVFTFTIPLRVAETPAVPPAEAPTGDVEVHSTARILLAEDDPMIREMISLMLAQHGLHPDTAESGRQAVEKWQDGGDFDLIFMDLQMPDMDGMEATRAIRQMETKERKRPCIIGLTGHARREIKEECLGAGMDRVLTKPVKLQELLSALETCL
jgi:PAS domain S-box-containing protein